MSKLNKAPLKEVTFRVRWHITTPEEVDQIQYFHGDFFNLIKNKFPIRTSLVGSDYPIELLIDELSHDFSKVENNFLNIKLGPTQITVNVTKDYYDWIAFRDTIGFAAENLNNALLNLITPKHYHLYLDYIDFIEFDFSKNDIIEYMRDFLHIEINQSFHNSITTPNKFGVTLNYDVNEIGSLSVALGSGTSNGKKGILIKTSAISGLEGTDISSLQNWIDKAHLLCSSTFKNMIKGPLYQSFK
jgi:uncharacterized protein (TIGR04255 family)